MAGTDRRRAGRTGRRPRRWAPVGVLVGALLAGCAGIPQNGPVVVGRAVDVPRAPLQIAGVGPQPGATPVEIVRGFLRSAADLSDDRTVARSYLTGGRQQSWRADASVVVYVNESQLIARQTAPAPSPSRTATGAAGASATAAPTVDVPAEGERATVTIEVPVTARVDADGEYRIARPGDVERRSFGLLGRGGQWRIDALDDGSILSRGDFDTTYRDLALYFPDPTGGWLVPDVRWFPVGNAIATVLVRAVLAGPAPWLATGVVTGAPIGTRLTAASVPVQQGNAMVDLTTSVRQADPTHRQMLHDQLFSTLAVLPRISQPQVDKVTMTVESRALDISKAQGTSTPDGRRPGEPSLRLLLTPYVDDAPVVLDKGRLMRLDTGRLVPVDGLKSLAGPTLSRPAVASDGSSYAVLSGGNRLLSVVSGGAPLTLVSGLGQLTAPSIDPLGWVWTAATSGSAVRAARPQRGAVPVTLTGWPAGLTVTSLRISRDGTRALVSGRAGGAGVLFVSAVERDANQVPQRLGPPQTLLPDLVSARSAAWLDQQHAVVLGRRGGEVTDRVWKVEIGGDAESEGGVPGADTVTAGNGDVYLSTPAGIQQLTVTGWVKVSSGASPAMPG